MTVSSTPSFNIPILSDEFVGESEWIRQVSQGELRFSIYVIDNIP